ncbi:MAG: ABC transporter permease subunit [Actinomycetota bacterium]
MPTHLLAQDNPGIADNEVLDSFEIPFGSWVEEAVNWTTLNLEWLLDAIAWPFEFLLRNLVEGFLVPLPWMVVVGAMFLIAWLVRNLTVATATAIGLTVCGLLGDQYWEETVRTIGLILVAVIVCVIIGIPVGILAGRVDSVWQVVRPTLDAMQVIHAFVYLLPFVYFWGVGPVAATMATMVFALPPLIRLTNLGVRQVPEDVVEAARAYGAPERRVLVDVQLPLARPAIMTGVNQTLLLAFSMLGIAAILGAGGLGALLFRALGQQDVALAGASGLAFFILAVILDRISQTDGGGSNLLGRITTAWRARSNPEVLLDNPDFNPEVERVEEEQPSFGEGRVAELSSNERTAITVAIAGGVLMVVSVFLTWANDAGLLTGYSRRNDADLAGQSFNGLAAEGGSWFAYMVALLGLLVIAAGATVWSGWQGGGRWLAPDGALFGGLGGLIAALGYLLVPASPAATGYSDGIGVYVAIIGGLVATVGALLWVLRAPYSPRRPLKPKVVTGPIVIAGIGVVLALISMFSSWILDERGDTIITPELQAEIDDLRAQADAGEIEPAVAASEIQIIRARAQAADSIVIDGMSSDGPQLGLWSLVLAALGLAGAAVCAGAAGLDDRRQWLGGTLAMGIGVGVTMLSIGWVGSLARAGDPNYFSGVGAMIGGVAGVMLYVAGSSIVAGFERTKVYRDLPAMAPEPAETIAPTSVAVPDPV